MLPSRICVLILLGIICRAYSAMDPKKSVPKFIKSEGYPVETHKVTTKSGFILGLHRIPYGREATAAAAADNATKPVVLLQHGFATSSDCWVLSGRKTALGFILADKGYDVWLANSRGTPYSFEHEKLNLTKAKHFNKFTKYSFVEKGVEDLPATIDYILDTTKRTNLALYAHSEGANMFYVMGAKKKKLLEKINSFYAFAPTLFIGNSTSPAVKMAVMLNQFFMLGTSYSIGKAFVSPAQNMLDMMANNFITKGFITTPFQMTSGIAKGQLAGDTLTRLYDYFPSYVSKRQLIHLIQIAHSNKFRTFDYNLLDFKLLHLRPKEYKLKHIDVPSYLYFSDQDLFVNKYNIDKYDKPFKTKPKVYYVENGFGHYDFVYGKDAHMIYNLTFDKLEKHSSIMWNEK